MAPKRLRQLAANPDHIPGVYNYCDTRGEPCPLAEAERTFPGARAFVRPGFDDGTLASRAAATGGNR